ncbi:GTP-binding protein EngA [Candidatus Nasuia deltocephalinicola]|uniref:GTP-binding protein EngA n=1 Tax=Candidatus Nasuia deltocephalincola TaxID=1160784 RepID=A0A7G6UHM5_9PROT|nr:GTP-binding protein EngA [Candidatus Nasuia deltocephalinicola]
MIPIISVIGKFNAGKSSFFNNINYNNINLFFNFKYLTLNIKKKFNIYKNFNYIIFDTSGFNFFLNFNFNLNLFIYESDIIFFFIDNNKGIFYEDFYISFILKILKKYIFLIINKIDIFNLNINIFYYYKLGFLKPYIINSSNCFNIFYTINACLSIYCCFKKCFHINFKINFFKIFFINFSKFQIKNFLNLFFNIKKIFFECKDIIDFNFKFLKFKFNLLTSFLIIKKFKNYNLNKFCFYNFLKWVVLSDSIFFFIDPFNNFENKFFIDFLLKKNLKFLIFLINYLDLIGLKLKIYFYNFFKFKYNISNFYINFLSIFEKLNFYYLFLYIKKFLNFFYFKINIKIKKFIFNLNNFLFFNKKKFKIFLCFIKQGSNKTPLIIIQGSQSKNLTLNNNFKFLKNFFIFFLKLKSVFLNFKLI